jgi:ABC-2 type transport system permease protein
MLFYATPIIYPLSMVIERLGQRNGEIVSKIMLLNPPAQIIQDIRANLIAPETTPTVWTMFSNFGFQIIPIVLTIFLLVLGIHVFNKHSQKFAEVL